MNTQGMHPQEQPISVGEWVLNLFLISIPIVNIIMLCIWAFGSGTNQTKTNFAKAGLIWIAVGIVLYVLFAVVIFSSMGPMMN